MTMRKRTGSREWNQILLLHGGFNALGGALGRATRLLWNWDGWRCFLHSAIHVASCVQTVLYRAATARPLDVVSTIKLSAIISYCLLTLSELISDCQLRPEDTPSYFGRQLAWFQGLGIQVVSTLYVSTLFSLPIRGGYRIQTLGEKRFYGLERCLGRRQRRDPEWAYRKAMICTT